MSLPLQVQQAGKKSEDLMKLHAEGKTPEDVHPAPSNNGQDLQPGDLEKQLEALQAKYDVLAGKYKKEIENADLKNLQRLENEVVLLKRENTDLKAALKANEDLVKEVREELEKNKQPAPEAPPVDVNEILTEEERQHLEAEDLGGKTLEIFTKLARAAGGAQLAGQLEQISTQVENVSKRVESAEKAQHQVAIESAIPDFDEINGAAEFHAWLDQPLSEYSMRTNREELQEALNSGNIPSVKKGIEAFKQSTGWKGTPKKPTTPAKPVEKNIEPDESFTGGSEPTGQKTYSMAEVKQFYEDQTKGRWKGREKEAAAIDRDILKAQQEGRIQP